MKYFIYDLLKIKDDINVDLGGNTLPEFGLSSVDLRDKDNAILNNSKLVFKGNYTFGKLTVEKGKLETEGIIIDAMYTKEDYLKQIFKGYKIVKTKVIQNNKSIDVRMFISKEPRYEIPLIDYYENTMNMYILKGFNENNIYKAFINSLKQYKSFAHKYKLIKKGDD